MKNFHFATRLWLLAALVSASAAARAQAPLPTPQPASSALRQEMRAAILKLAALLSADSTVRSELALPLAQLGDWSAALRLLRGDQNAPRNADELWQWRAYQLARAAKWRQVPGAAAKIQRLPVRADALLFAARQAVDRGVQLHQPGADSVQLSALLGAAAPLLEKSGSPQQQAYLAYLRARGGDYAGAERVFARVLRAAASRDARLRAPALKSPAHPSTMPFSTGARDVLLLQARAGLLQSALRHAREADDFLLGWWIGSARTQADLEALGRIVQALPPSRRGEHLFMLSIISSARGDKIGARAWFERARAQSTPGVRDETLAFYAAHFLGDEELRAQAERGLREVVEAQPPSSRFLKLDEIAVLPAQLDLNQSAMLGRQARPLSLARLDEIAAQLQAAAPSEVQFRTLEQLARHLLARRRFETLLPVARALEQTARKLSAQEASERAKASGILSPYWPRSPRALSAAFWLRQAGDASAAESIARDFARAALPRERPHAAMALVQLGYPTLADSIFDPSLEIPRATARGREQARRGSMIWDDFASWPDFAGVEARFRSPGAPMRWLGKLNPHARAQVLRAWTAALFPPARQAAPFVAITPTGSSSSL